jgi:uncharacterized OB-fold protein
MATNCQTCGCRMSTPKNRYCGRCSKKVRAELQRSGYLQSTYVRPYFSEELGRKGMRDPRVLGGVPH